MTIVFEGVVRRDITSFTRLVEMFDADLLRVAFLIAHDREGAHDAVQATWERLWVKPPALRDPTRLRSWLLTVAANEARQARRRSRTRSESERRAPEPMATVDPAAGVSDLDLSSVLSRQRAEDRELIALRYVLDMTSPQIAAHLGISAEGVRTRLRRVLGKLREELTNA